MHHSALNSYVRALFPPTDCILMNLPEIGPRSQRRPRSNLASWLLVAMLGGLVKKMEPKPRRRMRFL